MKQTRDIDLPVEDRTTDPPPRSLFARACRSSPWVERQLVLLICVTTLVLAFDFGARVLASNDESRFPMLARDILARGTWLLPRLNDVPHLNKPPLHAWLIALASWPSGEVTQSTAALPSLLAALGVVVTTYWIARRFFRAEVALAAGLIVVTTHGVFSLARVAMPDMTFCLALTAAMAMFVAAEFRGHRRALLAVYALVGVATLTKGPVALLGLVVPVVYTAVVGGWSGPRRLASPPGLLLLALLAVPWWLLAANTDPAALTNDVVVSDWLRWYLPQGQRTWRAVAGTLVPTALLPWALVLPWALASAVRVTEPALARRLRLLLVWAGVILVFVALSHEQRERYYLPLCPPVALLIAAAYDRLTLRHKQAIGVAVWLLVAVGLSVRQGYIGPRRNAATDLRTAVNLTQGRETPLFAVELPELPLAFYLKQPVVSLPDYQQFEALVRNGRDGYLIINDRALAASSTPSGVQRIGAGRLHGRHFTVLAPAG